MQLVRDVQVLAQELEDGIAGDVRLLVRDEQHLDAGDQQEAAEDEEYPVELVDQRGTQTDHDAAQDDDAQNSPDQHAVLIDPGNGEIREDQRYDEDVVHRQALLDEKAGEVLHARLRPEIPPNPGAEKTAHGDVAGAEPQAFGNADFMGFAVENAKVESQQGGDDTEKGKPDPGRFAQKVRRNGGH